MWNLLTWDIDIPSINIMKKLIIKKNVPVHVILQVYAIIFASPPPLFHVNLCKPVMLNNFFSNNFSNLFLTKPYKSPYLILPVEFIVFALLQRLVAAILDFWGWSGQIRFAFDWFSAQTKPAPVRLLLLGLGLFGHQWCVLIVWGAWHCCWPLTFLLCILISFWD